MSYFKLLCIVSILIALLQCAGSAGEQVVTALPEVKQAKPEQAGATNVVAASSRKESKSGLLPVQEKLREASRYLLGKTEIVVRGKRFNCDCSGLILALYYYAGIDLLPRFARHSGNGVERLYKINEANGLLTAETIPPPGAMIFWDNTYDSNEDGKWNDEFTHVGMVYSSTADGSIEYIHLNYRRGIILERMNLLKKDVYRESGSSIITNSPMRMKSQVYIKPDSWLSSHLFRAFGKAYLLQ